MVIKSKSGFIVRTANHYKDLNPVVSAEIVLQ